MNVLVTGAGGFIGKPLCKQLAEDGVNVTGIVRSSVEGLEHIKLVVKELDSDADLTAALVDVDVVIHLAARAHVTNETNANPIQAYFAQNVLATKHLASSAANAGVKRFIFLSSIGVNGNSSSQPFTEMDEPNPVEDYAISKKEAEYELMRISKNTEMDVVIVRPPLVYGQNAKGNFATVLQLCQKRLPLPFGSLHNKRSFIYVKNLVDFLKIVVNHPRAANQIFLVSDGQDVSTSYLMKSLIKFNRNKAKLISLPQVLLKLFFILIGKSAQYEKLSGDLQVNISKSKSLLGWEPPYSFDEGITQTAEQTGASNA